MKHTLIPYAIPFRRPIATGAGRWTVRHGTWLRLDADDGLVGWGEAAPLAAQASPAEAAAACAKPPLSDAAFDLARLDIEAQRAGLPLARWLEPQARAAIACNALCFADRVEDLAEEAAAAVAEGFGTLKIKVGAGSPALDIARVSELRRRVGPHVRLRLDANGAWDEATALAVLRALAPLDLDYVEDPVTGDARALSSRTGVAIATDVRGLAEGWCFVRERLGQTLVLKAMALGGLSSTRALALAAIEAGIGVVLSSVFDTAIGVAGALHLAAGLPGAERTHGLATVDLLADTPVVGMPPVQAGRIALPAGAGLGVRLRDDPSGAGRRSQGFPAEPDPGAFLAKPPPSTGLDLEDEDE